MKHPGKIRILFVAANPRGTRPIQLDEEIRAITSKIRESRYRDSLELISLSAVRTDDLLQGLNEHSPHIVHFSAHGTRSGEIILVSGQGKPKPVSAMALRSLFEILRDNVRIVVLNACYSRVQALAIAEVVDCVVGMRDSIRDSSAIAFAASFYRALGFGRSVKEAFEQGRVSLLLEGSAEQDVPDLLVRQGVNAGQLRLLEESIGADYSESAFDVIFKEHMRREDYQVSLIFMDLDKFEAINKRFGIKIGDEAHRIVAGIFQRGFEKHSYYVTRWPDDAFWACIKGDSDYAMNLAKQVKREIQRYPWDVVAPGLYVTGSFGVAQLREDDASVRHWMLRAILGEQLAKKDGGNQVCLGPYVLPKDIRDDLNGFIS